MDKRFHIRFRRIRVMSISVFVIAFLMMMFGMLVFLFINFKTLPVVKAGKVTKVCSKDKHVFGFMPNCIKKGNMRIDLSRDEKMIVDGNSMKLYKILDGQRIYVRKMSENERKEITTYPVLVFNIINNPNTNDAQYKLRKFVGYVNSDDSERWEEVFACFENRIKIPKADFVNQCIVKYQKMPQTDRRNMVLSETFDEDKNCILYSLHPVSTIYGKVEYAL